MATPKDAAPRPSAGSGSLPSPCPDVGDSTPSEPTVTKSPKLQTSPNVGNLAILCVCVRTLFVCCACACVHCVRVVCVCVWVGVFKGSFYLQPTNVTPPKGNSQSKFRLETIKATCSRAIKLGPEPRVHMSQTNKYAQTKRKKTKNHGRAHRWRFRFQMR